MSKQHTSVRAYGVLIDHDRVALVRSSNPRHQPPLWWLPGGGIEFGESPEDALVREVFEETGLLARDPQLLAVSSDVRHRDNGDRLHTVRVIYRIDLAGGTLSNEVHGTTDHAAWFDLASLSDVNLADYAREAVAVAQAK